MWIIDLKSHFSDTVGICVLCARGSYAAENVCEPTI